MNILKLFLIFLVFFYLNANGQKSDLYIDDTVIGKVTYIFVPLTLNNNFDGSREASLVFSENSSIFYHSRGKAPIFYKNGINCDKGCYFVDKIGVVVYKNFDKNSLTNRKLVETQPYISHEKIPDLDWKIHNDEKVIGSFTCQKATTHFRGRNYTAWFAVEIPVSDGPWKFSGLPGLILEVMCDDNEYVFLFKSIEIPPKIQEEISFKKDGIEVDFQTFIGLEAEVLEQRRKEAEARWLSSGGKPGGFKLTQVLPDPIELIYEEN